MSARALEIRCQCCEWYFTMDETQSLVCDECRLSEQEDDADDSGGVVSPALIAELLVAIAIFAAVVLNAATIAERLQ